MKRKPQRGPRRRPWERGLRARLLAALAGVRRRVARVDLAAASKRAFEELTDLASDLDELSSEIAVERCWKCGCSEYDPCDPPCAWASHEPPLCTACKPPRVKR